MIFSQCLLPQHRCYPWKSPNTLGVGSLFEICCSFVEIFFLSPIEICPKLTFVSIWVLLQLNFHHNWSFVTILVRWVSSQLLILTFFNVIFFSQQSYNRSIDQQTSRLNDLFRAAKMWNCYQVVIHIMFSSIYYYISNRHFPLYYN